MRANGTPQLAGSFPTLVPSNRQLQGDCKIAERGGSDLNAGRIMLRYLPTDAMEMSLSADYSKTHAEAQPDSKLGPHLATNVNNDNYDRNVIFPRFGIHFTGTDRFVTGNPFTTYAIPIDPVDGKQFPPDQYTTAWGSTGKLQYNFTESLRLDVILGYRTYESDWMGDGDQMPIDLNHTYELQSHRQKTGKRGSRACCSTRSSNGPRARIGTKSASHLGGYVTLPALRGDPAELQPERFVYYGEHVWLHPRHLLRSLDKLSLTAGARYTSEDKTYALRSQPYLLIPGELNYGSSHFDWKVSVNYRFNEQVMVYSTVSTGFRSDGAQPRPFTPGQQRIPVPAEELLAYEIGTKLDLFDRRLRLNIAAFMDDYDPRVFTANATQCNAANNLDLGPVYRGISPGNPCPAGTALAGTTGIPGSRMTARRVKTAVSSSS